MKVKCNSCNRMQEEKDLLDSIEGERICWVCHSEECILTSINYEDLV